MIGYDAYIEEVLRERYDELTGLMLNRNLQLEQLIQKANLAEFEIAEKYRLEYGLDYLRDDLFLPVPPPEAVNYHLKSIFDSEEFINSIKNSSNFNKLKFLLQYKRSIQEESPHPEVLPSSNATYHPQLSGEVISIRGIGGIVLLYLRDEKIIVPWFKPVTQNIIYNFLNSKMQSSLLHSQAMRSHSFVILTDAIDLIMKTPFAADIIFVSWYGGKDAVCLIDWISLKDVTCVYYYLTKHSGFSWESVLATMESVRRKLNELGIELRFITYADSFDDTTPYLPTRIPKCYSGESLKNKFFTEAKISTSRLMTQEAAKDTEKRDRATLFYPFILEQSISLIQGHEGSGARYFASCLAWALVAQQKLFKPWHGVCPVYVYYLYLQTPKGWRSFSLTKIAENVKHYLSVANRLKIQKLSLLNEKDNLELLLSDLKSIDDAYKTIFLDGLSYETTEEVAVLQSLIQGLRKQGWTIVVVTEGKSIHRLINPDTTIKLRKEKEINGKIRMKVWFNSCFDKEKNFYVEGRFNDVPPSLKKSNKFGKRKRYSVDQRSLLKEFVKDGRTIKKPGEKPTPYAKIAKKIAEKLGTEQPPSLTLLRTLARELVEEKYLKLRAYTKRKSR